MRYVMRILGICFALGALALSVLMTALIVSADDGATSSYVDDAVFTVSECDGGFSLRGGGDATSAWAESISALISEDMGDGVQIYFDDVRSEEILELRGGTYIFLGDLSLCGVRVSDGSDLTLRSLRLDLGDGCMEVLGGSVRQEDSTVISGECAVLLDYASTSRYALCSGEVVGGGRGPAVNIKRGVAYIRGGSIICQTGYGIKSNATLYLSGTPNIEGGARDIVTLDPIFLSDGDAYFEGTLDVSFTMTFEDGTLTPAFLGCNSTAECRIELYDENGMPEPIRYFDSYQGVGSRSFLGVYKPYTVSFEAKGERIATEYYLSGESIVPPVAPSKIGYSQEGWYLDDAFCQPYNLANTPNSDMTLYLKYKLDTPTYTLGGVSCEYDGNEHTVGFKSLVHPLEGGIYTFLWTDELGQTVSREKGFKVRAASDSGSYKCKVSYTFGSDTVSFESLIVTVDIRKAVLTLPIIPSAEYIGKPQYPQYAPSALYSCISDVYTDAGTYGVAFTLTDPDNYCWDVGDEATATVDFVIKPAANRWLTQPGVSDLYFGHQIITQGAALFGEAVFMYSSTKDGEFTATPPEAVGAYYAVCVVEGGSNYSSLRSQVISFTVLPLTPVAMSLYSPPFKTQYTAFDLFDPSGLTVVLTYDSGDVKYVTGGSLSIFYQNGDCIHFGDSGVTVEYLGVRLNVAIGVSKAEYAGLPSFSDLVLVYDGAFQTIPAPEGLPVGRDGITPTVRIVGGGANVGQYTVTLKFDSDSKNYLIPEDKTATLTILPCEVFATYGETDFVYDGTAKLPCGYYTDIYGARISLQMQGGAVNAGDYVANAQNVDPNYKILNPTVNYFIAKATYDMSQARWIYSGFVYDGNEKNVWVEGLPFGVRAVGYSSAFGINAGVYTASVVLDYDTANYFQPSMDDLVWEIEQAEYDLGDISFNDAEWVYDGSIHYPTVDGDMPCGVDGIALEYRFSGGATDVSSVSVLVTFYTESKNYKAPEPIELTVTVNPLGIYVIWQEVELEYDGKAKIPTAYSDITEIVLTGGGINAGCYTATATSVNPNYFVINSEYEYEILKAQNYWIFTPTAEDVFFGRAPSVHAEAKWGGVEILYYKDEGLQTNIAEPTSEGVYYAVAVVKEGENHLSLCSLAMEFEIIPIKAVGISVSVNSNKLSAFSSITDGDVALTVHNNDGSGYVVSVDEVQILGDGEQLLVGTREIVFSYCGVSASVTVEVVRADYDMSGASWLDTLAVYDGRPHTPTLTGLPAGVRVLSYSVVDAVGAGVYILGASLEYDCENYNPPIIPDGNLTIERLAVTVLPPQNTIYNGSVLYPQSDSALYYFPEGVGFTDAGKYTVGAVLYDSDNYCFRDDGRVEFCILPREISVRVRDCQVYLFERADNFSYDLLVPIPHGDDPKIRVVRDGDRLLALTDNPNYSLAVSEGRVVRISRLSETASGVLLVAVLLIFLGIATTLVVIRYRHSMVIIISGLRQRGRCGNISTVAPPPTPPDVPRNECSEEMTDVDIGTLSVDVGKADVLITDCIAKTLVRRGCDVIVTWGKRRAVVNIDTLSLGFDSGSVVDINRMKEKGMIPADSGSVKVLARGSIDKPLRVKANDFSLSAVKMIALTGGEAIKTPTFRRRSARINKTQN